MSVNSKHVKKSSPISDFEKWDHRFKTDYVTDGNMVNHASELAANGKVVVVVPISQNKGIKHNYLMSYDREHFDVMERDGQQFLGFTDFLQNAICQVVKGEFKGKKNKLKSLNCKIYKLDDEQQNCYALECKIKRHKVKPIDFQVLPVDNNKVIH